VAGTSQIAVSSLCWSVISIHTCHVHHKRVPPFGQRIVTYMLEIMARSELPAVHTACTRLQEYAKPFIKQCRVSPDGYFQVCGRLKLAIWRCWIMFCIATQLGRGDGGSRAAQMVAMRWVGGGFSPNSTCAPLLLFVWHRPPVTDGNPACPLPVARQVCIDL